LRTLREICGLTTAEIAQAFLVTPATLAQRIVRAKAKIRETPIPYEVPTPQELSERLDAVLQVVYLVFNEGYSAAAGTEVTRAELTGEAIRLGRLLTEFQPEAEVIGLLALMLLQESSRAARTSPAGELQPTGGRLLRSTTSWYEFSLHRIGNESSQTSHKKRGENVMQERGGTGAGSACGVPSHTQCCLPLLRGRLHFP
jgi:hypothetical protein